MSSPQGGPGGAGSQAQAAQGSPRDDLYQSPATTTTVLIVEDDQNSRFALSVLLERAQITVIATTNGAAALQTLKHNAGINIVLMDIMMPVMDGYETMTAIRKIPAHKDLPIIAVTAKVTDGERKRCIAAGASDYIPKPVDAAELLKAISRWRPAEPSAQKQQP
jgi:CheY-like chemotaxis protein